MVKVTEFKNHPVQFTKGIYTIGGEASAVIAAAEQISTALTSGSASDSVGNLKLKTLCTSAGITIPDAAVGVILDVTVNDSGAVGEDDVMSFSVVPGLVDPTNFPGCFQEVHCLPANDRKVSRLIMVPMDESCMIYYKIAASGGSTFDYDIRLFGWLLAFNGARALVTHPAANLKGKFVVNH